MTCITQPAQKRSVSPLFTLWTKLRASAGRSSRLPRRVLPVKRCVCEQKENTNTTKKKKRRGSGRFGRWEESEIPFTIITIIIESEQAKQHNQTTTKKQVQETNKNEARVARTLRCTRNHSPPKNTHKTVAMKRDRKKPNHCSQRLCRGDEGKASKQGRKKGEHYVSFTTLRFSV
jgi:hypothetical protein